MPLASWGVFFFFYNQLTKEEKTQFSFTDEYAKNSGTTSMWTTAAQQPYSWVILKGNNKGKSSQWAKFQVIHLAVYYV